MTTTISTDAQALFAGQPIDSQFFGGQWRKGRSGKALTVINPFDDCVVASIQQASAEDVDEAYKAAEVAQAQWAATTPSERREVLLRASQILEDRREEIVQWLITESGSTALKANIEVSLAVGITQESSSFPSRVPGPHLRLEHPRSGDPGLPQTDRRGWCDQPVEFPASSVAAFGRSGPCPWQLGGDQAGQRYPHYWWSHPGSRLRGSRTAFWSPLRRRRQRIGDRR